MLDEPEVMARRARAAAKRSPMRQHPRRLSNLLRDLAFDTSRDRISIGDLCDGFGDRAFGALIFLFAVPNALPVPPGVSAITGLPLMVLTFQFTRGQESPWLPRWIRDRSFSRPDFALMLARLEPWLMRLEHYLRPRLPFLVHPVLERAIGGLLFVLAFVLFLPVPLGNMLPGLAMSLIALAIVERDGACMLLGAVTGIASLVIVAGVLYGLALTAWFFLTQIA